MADWEPVYSNTGGMRAAVAGVQEQANSDPPIRFNDDGWEPVQNNDGWEPIKQTEPSPYEKLAEFGRMQHDMLVNTAVQPKPKEPGFLDKARGVAKTTTGLMGEAANFIGAVPPMAASYLVYGIDRMRGKDEKQASKAAMDVREKYSPTAGFDKISELAGIDPEWLKSEKFQQFMQEFHENVISPSAEKYTDPDTLARMGWEDVAYLGLFGGAHGTVKGVSGRYGKTSGGKVGPPADVEALRRKVEEQAAPIPALPEEKPVAPPELKEGDTPPLPELYKGFRDPAIVDPVMEGWQPVDNGPMATGLDLRAGLVRMGLTEAEAAAAAKRLGPAGPERLSKFDEPPKPDLPIINDYPQPYIDQLGPDVDTTGKMHNPYMTNVVDMENAQRPPEIGAHSEMRLPVEPQDPIRGPKGTLSFDEGIAQDIENKRFQAGLAEEPGKQNRASGQFRLIDETDQPVGKRDSLDIFRSDVENRVPNQNNSLDISDFFHSKLKETFDTLPYNPGKLRTVDQWIADVKKVGAKKEELYWSGVIPALETVKSQFKGLQLTKDDIQTLIKQNLPKLYVEMRDLSSEGEYATQYEQYANYRLRQSGSPNYEYIEFIFHSPDLGTKNAGYNHFTNISGHSTAIFHARATILTSVKGDRHFVVEEIQGDPYQKARERGFESDEFKPTDDKASEVSRLQDEYRKLKYERGTVLPEMRKWEQRKNRLDDELWNLRETMRRESPAYADVNAKLLKTSAALREVRKKENEIYDSDEWKSLGERINELQGQIDVERRHYETAINMERAASEIRARENGITALRNEKMNLYAQRRAMENRYTKEIHDLEIEKNKLALEKHRVSDIFDYDAARKNPKDVTQQRYATVVSDLEYVSRLYSDVLTKMDTYDNQMGAIDSKLYELTNDYTNKVKIPFKESWWKLAMRTLVNFAQNEGLPVAVVSPKVIFNRNGMFREKMKSYEMWHQRYIDELTNLLGKPTGETEFRVDTDPTKYNVPEKEITTLVSFGKEVQPEYKTYLYSKDAKGENVIVSNREFVKAAYESQTADQLLRAVSKHTKNPEYRVLADFLADAVKDVRVKFEKGLDAPGRLEIGAVNGAHVMKIRDIVDSVLHKQPWGLNERTILHEATHGMTEGALYIGNDPFLRTQPRFKAFAEFADRTWGLLDVAKKYRENDKAFNALSGEAKELIDYALSNPSEFLAHLTDPLVKEYYKRIKLERDTLFDKAIRAVSNLFRQLLGKPEKEFSVFEKGLELLYDGKQLKEILDNAPKLKEVIPDAVSRDLYKEGNLGWTEDVSRAAYEPSFQKDIDPNWTAYEAMVKNGQRDLEKAIPHNVITPNQVANISDSPLMKWTVAKFGQIFRQAAPRFHRYADTIKPYMFGKDKLSRDESLNVFKTLVDIQDPATKDIRAMAEQSNGREAYLQQKGLTGRPLEFAIKVLDIMQDVHKHDMESVARLGRKLDYEPMYFPRIHGGRFILKVLDEHGVEQYVKGFDSYREAREKESELRQQLKDMPHSLRVQNVERAERQTFGDDFTMLLLENSIPMDFLEKGLRGFEKARETAPFVFEKNRRDTNVGGYVGEDIAGKAEQERLLKAMSWRLQASRNLEQKSRILSEIKFPLFDTASLGEMPRLRAMIGYMVNRELGVDISGKKVTAVDYILGKPVEAIVEATNAVAHFEDKYLKGRDVGDYRWEDPKVGQDIAKEVIRQWTYAVSLIKLGLNPPVLVTNFASNLLLPLFGLRTAGLEGINKGYAMTALWRSLIYSGTESEGATAFMKQARNEGMIETKGHEHYTTAELPDRNVFDRAVQYPRDRIEEMTNYASILYYYHMFKHARPDLTGEALKEKVYNHARTFTGQYDSFAGPLMFDKAGNTGQLFTNFSKWHFNQLGILLNDMKQVGVDKNVIPILATLATVTLAGGLYGLPLVVEYEAIRRLGMDLSGTTGAKAWDLPPISALRGVLKDRVPYWNFFERGAFSAGTDALARVLGAPSGPDVSGSMRYASFLDVPTVAIQTFFDLVGKIIPTTYKEMKSLFGGPGASAKDIENAFNALPPAIKEVAKRAYSDKRVGQEGFFKQKIVLADGSVRWLKKDPSNMGQAMYSLSDIENSYNMLNMKSMKEVRTVDAIYYHKWQERTDKAEIQELTAGIMGHVGDKRIFKQNILEIAKKGGATAVNNVLSQMRQQLTASQVDYFTREYEKLSKTTDGVKAQREFERIRKSRRLAE